MGGKDLGVVEVRKLLAQAAHLGRIVVNTVEQLANRQRLIVGKVRLFRDSLKEGRAVVKPIVFSVLFNDETCVAERSDVAVHRAAVDARPLAQLAYGERAVLRQEHHQAQLLVKLV